MDIILIPGLWLDGSSWDLVVPTLERPGHRVHPLTLPGMEGRDADRSGVSLEDWVGAVVATIDACDPDGGPVLLVGHSAGGGVAHAAADARPDRIARVVYVGGFPTPHGRPIVDGFSADGVEIPLPDWSEFDEADLQGLDGDTRAFFRRVAIPVPSRVVSDLQQLSDDRRYEVPATAVCTEYAGEMLRGWIEAGFDPVREFALIREVEFVDLPTGHWPQFTRPTDLADVILGSVGKPGAVEEEA